MFSVFPIRALKDNYIWLITRPGKKHAIAVDPGEASLLLETLKTKDIILEAVLLTHHHHDHIAGTSDLLKHFSIPVYGPAGENIAIVTHPLQENDIVSLLHLEINFQIFDIPGHTRGHIAYFGDNMLFCGDTLFTGGCGRLFEGTATQLFHSLKKLAALPEETQIYCGHEYTLSNLRFAQCVEPDNSDIKERYALTEKLRMKGLPSVPSTLAVEKLTNPFLRCHTPQVQASVEKATGHLLENEATVFKLLRQWKDSFK